MDETAQEYEHITSEGPNRRMPKENTANGLTHFVTMVISIAKSILGGLLLNPIAFVHALARYVHLWCCCVLRPFLSWGSMGNSTTTILPSEHEAASNYFLQGDWVVHERQSLQLCAVHAINNLLQLSEDDRDVPWSCGRVVGWKNAIKSNNNRNNESTPSSVLQSYNVPGPASQVELDHIACDLMRAEEALLDRRQEESWFWNCLSSRCCNSFTNTHRTLYYGNYSFETLEVALQHRQVTLEWFHIPAGAEDLLNVPSGVVVGFIINHVITDDDDLQNNPNGRTSFPRSILKKCCDDPGRHWYAITRVRRRSHDARDFQDNTTNVWDDIANLEAPEEDRWKILDSDSMGTATILQTDQLREYLQQLSSQDATLFRATLNIPVTIP